MPLFNLSMLVIAFSILLASFIISNYFYTKSDEIKNYPKKDYFNIRFISSLFLWIIFVFSLYNEIVYSIFIILLIMFSIYELILMIRKLGYFNNEFKIILKNKEYNDYKISLMRKLFVIKGIEQIFYLLGSPLLLIQYFICFVLKKIF